MNTAKTRREREKNVRKNEIITAAEQLFLKKGFERTSVDEIGKLAQFTKRTIYQYFVNKEDLFYAVVLNRARELQAKYTEIYGMDDSALEKIRKLNKIFYTYFLQQTGLYPLMSFKPSDRPNKEKSPHFKELCALKAALTKKYEEILAAGQKDGSIAPDLDVKMATNFGMITAMGLLNIIMNIEQEYWDLRGIEREKFIDFSYGLLADILGPRSQVRQ
jgi:TetR/AcrR family transcriptional regulator